MTLSSIAQKLLFVRHILDSREYVTRRTVEKRDMVRYCNYEMDVLGKDSVVSFLVWLIGNILRLDHKLTGPEELPF